VDSILSAVDYCLAITRLDIHTRDIVIRICDGALELCELDMATGREARARSILECVKSICDQESECNIFEALETRIVRADQMLIRLGDT
jgi:hypothetical protein